MAAVELRKKNGKWLSSFYVRLYLKGTTQVVNTKIKWRGTPPESMKKKGDEEFENAALTKLIKSAKFMK